MSLLFAKYALKYLIIFFVFFFTLTKVSFLSRYLFVFLFCSYYEKRNDLFDIIIDFRFPLISVANNKNIHTNNNLSYWAIIIKIA